jgi:[acyl-carrier-protein] S-malonyltransferase
MQACTTKHPGGMAAILGLPSTEIEDICKIASNEGLVICANYNSPVQTVISGERAAVSKAIELSKARGAKRAVELNVSGAFHSPLMKEAANLLYQYASTLSYQDPIFPVYLNSTAEPLVHSELFYRMQEQIQSPVYFEKTIINMRDAGITHFIEVGPGSVLSGLVKKFDLNLEVINISKYADLEQMKGWLKTHEFIK